MSLAQCPSTMYPVGRNAWSLQHASNMAVGLGQATDEEARAEVDVLKSRLDKTSQLTKKIQASLTRLETTGKSVQDAVGPIYGSTQKYQVIGASTDQRVPFVNVD
jgi:prefoldin subunit 5